MRSGLHILGVVVLLSSCFEGPGFMGQTKRDRSPIDARNIHVDVDGEVLTASVSAGASFTQVVTAPETTSLKGVSAAFSPGSLVIDTKIVVEEAAPFANDRLLAELGIKNTFTAASVAVAIQPAVKTNPAQPFQIALPMPGLNTLNLSGNENVVVAYRYEDATTGKITAGIIPNSDLQFSEGRVSFYAKYFGVFQATVTEQKIVAAVDAVSESTILTKRDTTKLAPLQLLNRKPVVVQAGKTVEITGQNIRPSLFLAVNGKPVSKVNVKSDASAQFIMPEQARLGLANITAEQDGVTEKLSLVYTNPNDYPVITLAETEVCAGSKYYDLNGTLKTGTKNCGPTINWPSTNGVAGQVLGTDGNGNLNWINASSGGMGSIGSAEITDGTITDADIAATAAISYLKIYGLGDAASKNVGTYPGNVAAGNHTHSMQHIVEAGSCASGNVLQFTGSSWTCAAMPGSSSPAVTQAGTSYNIMDPHGSLLVAHSNDSMWTLPSAMGTGYSITVKNNSNGFLKIMPPFGNIDGDSSAFFLYSRGNATFTYSGSEWFVTNVQGDSGRVMPEACGGVADDCYNDSTAIAAGFARTPSGKMLVRVQNPLGFYVWKNKYDDRVLAANGSDEWSMERTADGRDASSVAMTRWKEMKDRVCPTNVYMNDGNKFVTGQCLYYFDLGQKMPTLPSWSTAQWFSANLSECTQLGARLPTIYEVDTSTTSSGDYPNPDGMPAFGGTRLSFGTYGVWTATAGGMTPSNYYIAVGYDGIASSQMAYSSKQVYCVVP